MPRVSLKSASKAAVIQTPPGAVGDVETRAILSGERDPIHLYQHRLGPGASLRFVGEPTECVVYVLQGAVEAGGVRIGPHSSVIVEYGAALTVVAGSEGAVLAAFNLQERDPSERSGGHVHLLPSERVPRATSTRGVGLALHADAQCPTCKVWLHENDFQPNEEIGVHSHSEDEVIFVIGGSIRLGKVLHGPGAALAIAANTKYSFATGPEGLSFINFRGASPTYSVGDSTEVMDEAQFWRSHVGAPEYLTPPTT